MLIVYSSGMLILLLGVILLTFASLKHPPVQMKRSQASLQSNTKAGAVTLIATVVFTGCSAHA